ncbi:isopeptide-forming domain-containing fimbrial protein, partial [Bacillus cereus]|uniref:isopeptide-forming domain-containing fimbrial protein n=1 Tax=Bacillus cereus TaxID=1396 RepID=UPI003D168270
EKSYNYNVKSKIADDVRGYKTLTISDTLDKRLDIVSTRVLVDGEATNLKAEVKGQDVKLTLDREQLDAFVGKEVNLQITAKIKDKTPIENIPNKADIQLNNDPKIDSNEVTVIPPNPEKPTITKDVEGKEHIEVEREKEYKYNVRTNVAKDVKGYKTLTLTDTLDSRLDIVSVKVLANNTPTNFKAEVKGQEVKLVLTRSQLDTVQGKELNLQIVAKIKDGTPIEKIPNKADIQLNNEPKVDS